jgi:hypothetical protein
VGEEHGDRAQPVLTEDFFDPVYGVLARVDDDAFLARRRGGDKTVRPERSSGEPGDEHGRPLW